MTTKERVGALPAAGVLIAFFASAVLAALLLGDLAPWAGIGLVALLIAYCWARPAGGWNVFWIAAAPNAFGAILHDLAGTPKWLALVVVPVAVWLAHEEDREADGTSQAQPERAPAGES